MNYNLDFVQFLASRSRGSALQFFSFFAKFIAEGAIYEQKKKKRASDSLGDAVTKLYKVEITAVELEYFILQRIRYFFPLANS